ncbi:MAG: hypothetical protein JGK21_13495 [Microcoleus sp. PH2017_22_RUC_O_B]|uniref:hormogonium polysaccharide biosynthesis protein HpsA n=1 Tax=unclassified Microcoleus TaxID=2642155 RepID=UPI001DA5F090|nr:MULTISPECIES: hormogonium polysaccharide biosynthesis protein HpsA [unclassified Microcoleus]MCC3529109.1 hypothetical protein [Microcoleus sp. PH2017_21_RUC_O_A]MCC3541366.1 hypothetical protein [Microcoleus sp. PH2017_22_RUC_O_B]
MFKSKLSKVIVSLLRRIAGVTRSGAKRLMRAMLQALMAMGRRAKLPVAGFVLPTVTMVLLVVILLTVAIVLRSFDRANLARNVRVNQQVLAAATPALDRAKAKIQFLLYEDPQRPTATPSDAELYSRMAKATGTDIYTFGDEKRLIVTVDLNNNNAPDGNPEDPPVTNNVENEAINTAWRYPVDTNNDGKFDTFTLYGIYFRSPKRSKPEENISSGFSRARKPVDARTPPMSVKGLNPNCVEGEGTVANLVGDSGWYKKDGKLKKSFFVYTVNVPIKDQTEADAAKALDTGREYKPFTGTTSISALEYQQDQIRIPLANNAVVYEDDLDISPGPLFNINGRVFTNSNLLVTNLNGADRTRLYQVSSPDSCFYEQENSKIVVAGNVVNGYSGNTSTTQINAVGVHLFKNASLPASNKNQAMLTAAKTIKNGETESSTTNSSLEVLYNNEAYSKRLSMLVAAQMVPPLPDGSPNQVVQPSDPFSVKQKPETQTREQALREYFKQMLRKVPFAEVGPPGVGATEDATAPYVLPSNPPITGTGDTLRPKDPSWMLPDAKTRISLKEGQLETTKPTTDGSLLPEEVFLGDRVVAGNNLPAIRWDASKNEFTSKADPIPGNWNATPEGAANATDPRTRTPQITKLADVGSTDRGGFWEGAAAQKPENPLDGVGGLRIITSAGVYERTNSFLPPPAWIDPQTGLPKGGETNPTDTYDDPTTPGTAAQEKYPVVWPDTMPMSPLGPGSEVYNNNGAPGWVGYPTSGLSVVTGSAIDPRTPQYAKGDLRMRATAVYHYEKDGSYVPPVPPNKPDYKGVRPFACVSSYYDPSTASTANNLDGLPLGVAGTQIGSNNGVVYGRPADKTQDGKSTAGADGLLGGTSPNDLQRQANYVFPDGRFANEPLRKALLKEPGDRTLADRAAIDSTMCALGIIANTPLSLSADIPHGAIQEVAFLNAREIKAIDRDDLRTPNVNEAFTLSSPLGTDSEGKNLPAAQLTGNYNQPLEERQPLEIRATQIDLDVLRSKSIAGEPLLPYSGIIYASRDDALPDRSARIPGTKGIDEVRSATVSPTDSLLDPTRKPNGILLVNGSKLARVPSLPPTVANVVREKGLTLASNLPVYVKGDFNLHTQEEFGTPTVPPTPFDWSKFYDRKAADLNKNFACRPNDPRLSDCKIGDEWRPANILSDAVTLLSNNYRFGFRNEGDFDLRNNAGAAAVIPRKQQGFYSNNFVTNGLSSGAFSNTGQLLPAGTTGIVDASYANINTFSSSYFNNYATPVQRRGEFPEYVMEVCTRLPVSACTDSNWYVNPPTVALPAGGKATVGESVIPTAYPAGTTAIPPTPALQRFPRRVAFQRNSAAPFNLTDLAAPVPLGVNTANQVIAVNAGTPAKKSPNSLWFATTDTSGGNTVTYGQGDFPYVFNRNQRDSTGQPLPVLAASSTPPTSGSQPLLMPVLQIQTVGPANREPNPPTGGKRLDETGWMPQALTAGTTFNMVVASNDTPSRTLAPDSSDFNGGLQNLPRFLENWRNISSNIQGSFIQFNRSAYSTAPYTPILPVDAPRQADDNTQLRSLFALSGITSLPPLAATPTPATLTPPGAGYRTSNGSSPDNPLLGRIPFFIPPSRNWGYDVGLLSQPPDLFTQKFTTPPSRPSPDEYFREVGRDDEWVTTLMCSKLAENAQDATSSRSNCKP